MARRGDPLHAGRARRAGGPRAPAQLLLAGLALLGAARARALEDGGFSLHPPYFNLAEGARIAASATCGEEAPARGPPRPTEDLYCKLVGGPVAGGDPNQTIQVSARWGVGGPSRSARTRAPRAGRAQVPTLASGLLRSAFRATGRDPKPALRPGRGTARPPGRAHEVPPPRTRGRRAPVQFGSGDLTARGYCCPVPRGPKSWISAGAGLGVGAGGLWGGGGRLRLPPGQAGTCWPPDGDGMKVGGARRTRSRGWRSPCRQPRAEASRLGSGSSVGPSKWRKTSSPGFN